MDLAKTRASAAQLRPGGPAASEGDRSKSLPGRANVPPWRRRRHPRPEPAGRTSRTGQNVSYAKDQQGIGSYRQAHVTFANASGLCGCAQEKFMEIHSYDTPRRGSGPSPGRRRGTGIPGARGFADGWFETGRDRESSDRLFRRQAAGSTARGLHSVASTASDDSYYLLSG